MNIDNKITPSKPKVSKIFSKIGRKNIIIICSMLLIGTAIYLNWAFFSTDQPTDLNYGANGVSDDNLGTGKVLGQSSYVSNVTDNENNYFAVSQISRQRARDEAMEVLQLVVDNTEALQEVKDKALTDITQIAAEIESEANVETLILAKGFEECVAVINGENANIIVKTTGLLPNELSQIKEIVYEQAGINPSKVKILEKN